MLPCTERSHLGGKQSAVLTQARGQRLHGHGAMAALHVDRAGDVNKQWWHVQLWGLVLQQGLSLQDAERVLVLVHSVGVRQGLVLTLSLGAAAWVLLILHHQIGVALRHYAGRRHIFCKCSKTTLK